MITEISGRFVLEMGNEADKRMMGEWDGNRINQESGWRVSRQTVAEASRLAHSDSG
jgi:hypothetical protein